MLQAIQSSQVWLKCQATIVHNNRLVQLRVHLQNNSIADSYLVIEDAPQSCCFIPIVPEVICTFSIPDLLLSLKFSRYENICMHFKMREMQDLELLVSHFGKSSILLSYTDDKFKAENLAFLRRIKPQEVMKPLGSQSDIGSSTALSPITLNPAAREIWETRVREQNTQFYIKEVPLRFAFLTWNVASHEPSSDIIEDMAKSFKVPAAYADIVIIALEEIDMSFKSVVTGSSRAYDKWTELIGQAKSIAEVKYRIVASESMGGVYCAALVREDIDPEIKNYKIDTLKLGANGMLANKAAVRFHWSIGEATCVAICCHLAPHDQNWEQRNTQWHEIVEGLKYEADYIIFLGDLNYRIVMGYEECKEKIEQRKLDELLEKDQLKITQKTDQVIGKFFEPPIKFPPTFKFNKDSDVYDTSAKKRVPSWTDRILIKTAESKMRIGLEDVIMFETDAAHYYMNKSRDVFLTDCNCPMHRLEPNFPRQPQCICYRMIRNSFSDHRPVASTYKFPVPVVITERLEELNEIMLNKYEEMKTLSIPTAISVPDVLHCEESGTQSFELVNRSTVWVQWKVKKLPQGVTLSPSEGILMACERLKVEVKYDSHPGDVDQALIEIKGGNIVAVKIER